jgi:hypothetical protein
VLAAYLAMLGMVVAFEATAEVRSLVAGFSAPAARQARGVAAITPSSGATGLFRPGRVAFDR